MTRKWSKITYHTQNQEKLNEKREPTDTNTKMSLMEWPDQGLYNNHLKEEDYKQSQVLLKQMKIEKKFNIGVMKRAR